MRRFINVSREYLLILLVAICVIITIGNYYRTNTLVDGMANIKSGYEVNIRTIVESNTELKKEVRLLQMKVNHANAKLDAQGEH